MPETVLEEETITMTRRPAIVGLAALLAAATAACARPSTGQPNQATAPTSAASTAAPNTTYRLPACTPTYQGGDGSGILLAGGTVTGSFTLAFTPMPGPNGPSSSPTASVWSRQAARACDGCRPPPAAPVRTRTSPGAPRASPAAGGSSSC
jgi:hypothetical protein